MNIHTYIEKKYKASSQKVKKHEVNKQSPLKHMTGFKSCVGLFSRLYIALNSVEYPNYLFKPKQVSCFDSLECDSPTPNLLKRC